MELERINKAVEYVWDDEQPSLDGHFIRNLLVMGLVSKNPWNASNGGSGDPHGPRRNFAKICATESEYSKLNGLPSYILHAEQTSSKRHSADDKLGTFCNSRPSPKGLRADLECLHTAEGEYPVQVAALRDNIEHKRPFGGFSPAFDLEVNRVNGAVESIVEAESIDLVPNPASVKSAVESEAEADEPLPVSRDEHEVLKKAHESLQTEHAALDERVKALECHYQAVKAAHEATVAEEAPKFKGVRSDVIPPVVPAAAQRVKSIFDFVRS